MSNCYGLLMGIQSCIIYHLLHSLSKIFQVFPNVLTYYSIILLFARGMSSLTPKMSLIDGFAHLYIVKLHKSHILSHYGPMPYTKPIYSPLVSVSGKYFSIH